MDALLEEKINTGLIYLYNSTSRQDFYERLDLFLGDMISDGRFAVLVPAEGVDRFVLDHLSGPVPRGFDRPLVECPALHPLLGSVDELEFPSDTGPLLSLPGGEFRVVRARVLAGSTDRLGILVFDSPVSAGSAGQLLGLEGFLLDHVTSAFQQAKDRESLVDRLEESQAKLDALRDFSDVLGQLEIEALLSRLMAVCMQASQAQVGSIVLDDAESQTVEWGLERRVLDGIRKRGGESIREMAIRTGEPVLVRNYSTGDYESVGEFHIGSVLCVPLISKRGSLGTVNLVGGDPESGVFFSEKDKAAIVTISSLAGTAIENAFLHQESLEKAKLKANLQIARTIQQGMYPTQALEIPGYAMAWVTRSCDETGGDYFDFIAGADGCIYCAVGDVSGHGIGAALLMATGRAELRALLSVKTDCKEIVDRLNGLLAQDMDSAKFMTLVLFRLDPRTHALTHVNAGHDPPILLRADGRTMDVLGSTGIPLGMLPEWSYEVGADRVFAIGDALLLTTDGVWEAPSPSGDRYGKRRLEEVLLRHAGDGAQGVVDAILEDVDRFTSGVLQDDLTIVVLKRLA